MARPISLLTRLAPVLVLVAACSGGTTTTTAPVTAAPVTAAPATAAAAATTVEAKAVGSAGTILVDGASGKTLYMFTKDVKDNGKSACNGECAANWPALSVAAGASPTGGTGVTGKLATITRDDGALQVTYNGVPLYFFKNDQAAGDLNGVYENWETVKP